MAGTEEHVALSVWNRVRNFIWGGGHHGSGAGGAPGAMTVQDFSPDPVRFVAFDANGFVTLLRFLLHAVMEQLEMSEAHAKAYLASVRTEERLGLWKATMALPPRFAYTADVWMLLNQHLPVGSQFDVFYDKTQGCLKVTVCVLVDTPGYVSHDNVREVVRMCLLSGLDERVTMVNGGQASGPLQKIQALADHFEMGYKHCRPGCMAFENQVSVPSLLALCRSLSSYMLRPVIDTEAGLLVLRWGGEQTECTGLLFSVLGSLSIPVVEARRDGGSILPSNSMELDNVYDYGGGGGGGGGGDGEYSFVGKRRR
jgi:hypothetical protein